MVIAASIMVTACMAQGPLFQCASKIQNTGRVEAGSVDIRSVQFLPTAYFGDNNHSDFSYTRDYKSTINNMYVDAISYNMSQILCADGCTSFINVRMILRGMMKSLEPYTDDLPWRWL